MVLLAGRFSVPPGRSSHSADVGYPFNNWTVSLTHDSVRTSPRLDASQFLVCLPTILPITQRLFAVLICFSFLCDLCWCDSVCFRVHKQMLFAFIDHTVIKNCIIFKMFVKGFDREYMTTCSIKIRAKKIAGHPNIGHLYLHTYFNSLWRQKDKLVEVCGELTSTFKYSR